MGIAVMRIYAIVMCLTSTDYTPILTNLAIASKGSSIGTPPGQVQSLGIVYAK